MSRGWSAFRLATGLVLATWAGLFWYLIVTDRIQLYLSSRTAWVVPMGAIVLTVATAGRLATARAGRPEPLRSGDAWGLGLIILPVVTVLALPPAALGSFAASRRSVSAGVVAPAGDVSSGPVTLASVAAAMWSDEAREALADRAGTEVSFEGIVTRREGMPADEFVLARFIISCCVADALSVQVRVVGSPPGEFREDQWVRVRGTFYPVARETVVDATSIEAIPRPDNPYLNV
jgi:uncharacterized repeat protein (TIGR03943 family)